MDIALKRINSKSVTTALLIMLTLSGTAMTVAASSVGQPSSVHGQKETTPMLLMQIIYRTTPTEAPTSFQGQQLKYQRS